MKHLAALALSLAMLQVFSQSNAVEKLKEISEMPYICRSEIGGMGCGQKEFWNVVEYKLDVIPFLIEKLDDTTQTLATVPNFGGYWTVADVAYSAIEEIIDGIPTFELLGVSFDAEGCGYCSYWIHLNSSYENRLKFKIAVATWYSTYKSDLHWVVDNKTLTCDCSFSHPNQGHYEVNDKTERDED